MLTTEPYCKVLPKNTSKAFIYHS